MKRFLLCTLFGHFLLPFIHAQQPAIKPTDHDEKGVASPTVSMIKKNPVLTRTEAFEKYSVLLQGRWQAKGTWEKGGAFHQEVTIEQDLSKNIFIARTYDFIDATKYDKGQRNYGVRAWDEKEQKMKFWEFDVFGGITTGEVRFEGKDIYFVYQYPAKDGNMQTLADAWIFVNKDSYEFRIGAYRDGSLEKVFMSTTYKRI